MDKALEMGKTSATGSFHLLIGVAGSSIIMALGTLVLAGLLPVNDVGLYGFALIPSSIINYFRDWGVNYAMTQQIASLRAAGKEAEIHDVIFSGIIFELITGAVLALVCFAIAQPLAFILSPSDVGALSIYISIMSLSIFAGAIFAACTAVFTGFERMKLNSLTQILQAVVKTSLGPALIIIGFGVLGAIFAALASFIAGGVVSALLVYFLFFKPLRASKVGKRDVKQTLKPMLKYGLPLTFSATVVGVLPLVFAFSMAVYAGKWMMGNYYAASYFSVLLTFISIPVATALFPAFSKLNPEKDPALVKTVFASSTKYAALLMVPATMMLITLATPLINFLFPVNGILNDLFVVDAVPKFPFASIFLAVSCIVNLLVLVGNISLGTFQQGIGKTNQIMKQSILSLALGLPLAYLLVAYFYSLGGSNIQLSQSYAVIGGILGAFIQALPATAWGLYWGWKNYKVKADFGNSAKILAAAVVASLVTYAFITFVSLPYVITLVLGCIVFLVVYLATAPLIGAINKSDIDNFKAMFSSLGIFASILDIPLIFMRKVCSIKKTKIPLENSKVS